MNKLTPAQDASDWTSVHTPAAATQATTTKAAGAAGVRHIVKFISASIACGATAQTPIAVELLDGAAVVWSQTLAAPVNGVGLVQIAGLNIIGSPATSLTLRFAAAGVAASVEAVTVGGYDQAL